VVHDALAGGAVEHLIALEQLVVSLRRDIHVAPLADALQDIDNSQAVAPFAKGRILFQDAPLDTLCLLLTQGILILLGLLMVSIVVRTSRFPRRP